MKRALILALSLALCARGEVAVGAGGGDGGGRDVSVALFSTRVLHAVTLTPAGAHAWVARCPRCAREPFREPVHVSGSGEVYAGGRLRVTDDGSGEERSAAGLWHVRATGAGGGEVEVVLTLASERYVEAVLTAEAAAGEPAESLRALTILARTYALRGRHFSAARGHLRAELCDSTECQAMRLGATPAAVEEATRITAGETLWSGGERAEVFFSQNCGGMTEDAGAVWPALRGVSYLRSHADPYCVRRDGAAWHAEVTVRELLTIARGEGWRLPAAITGARVAERSGSHRAERIVFQGVGGETGAVSASALRFGIGRALGWGRVRSDAYDLAVRGGVLVFDGRGHGHGVGLCQAGATEMAAEGKQAREILQFYFPGTQVRLTAGDRGWESVGAGPLTIRGTEAWAMGQTEAARRAWTEAQRRFPPGSRALRPEIVFAPTTEVFRQLTNEPGWALASTRGSTVVLQPRGVFRAHRGDVGGTLLHEMLHVLVEAEANERAPLWLREGVVEMLAEGGSPRVGGREMGAAEIDGSLARAGSLRESEGAHRAAAVRVRQMVDRYGFSAVRGWLSAGVPPGVE